MDNISALILQHAGIKTSYFSPTSRYYGIDTVQLERVGEQPISYVKRRIISPVERFHVLQEHVVTQNERPDNLTAQYLSDPEQFWRVCDSNVVMYPNELIETLGRRIKITLPEGIQGI